MSKHYLADLARWPIGGTGPKGITSICSAHPLVIETALVLGERSGGSVLIEATCNQVNHRGGYTGMTPADFRQRVVALAQRCGLSNDRIILGGDHLGPNPWKDAPADAAMEQAGHMVAAYVEAGFTKIHLDTSMGCRGEPVALDDAATAARAATLAEIAEESARSQGLPPPVYVIGTEVPVPGGALEEIDEIQPTSPDSAVRTLEVHRDAFEARGLQGAFQRVVAVVVQPGVEFGHENVVDYEPEKARALSEALSRMPGVVFEAHSTDYQTPKALALLVDDGFRILKVGPALTFALREALYALDCIAEELAPEARDQTLAQVIEQVMVAERKNWEKYYRAETENARRIQRHYSYSDRLRYYWPAAKVEAAVEELMRIFSNRAIPDPLVSQFLAPHYRAARQETHGLSPEQILHDSIAAALRPYFWACGETVEPSLN